MAYNIGVAEQHRTTLELSARFSEAELKTAYRKLIRKWHPDRYTIQPQVYAEATERAKQINVAYEYLSEFFESVGGSYRAPVSEAPKSWSWTDLQPKRTYQGKTYTAGFPDPTVTEIFLKSSAIISTGYNRSTQTLYIKFASNSVYRYFGVPADVFEAFLEAPSHGRFGHQHIFKRYRQEPC
jgi:hypothetical protein